MRKCLVCFLCLPVISIGQVLEPTLLWRITPPGASAPSYLYGTVHSKDDRAYHFGDSVLPALDRCAIAAGELDLAVAGGEMGMALLTSMRMKGDGRLEELYTKREWKRVDAAIRDGLGPMAPMAMGMKPFFIMAMLTENAMGGSRPQVLDEFLQERARDSGKRVIGMETVKEQMAAIDAVSLKEQAKMLLDHVDHGGYPGAMDAMLDAYARQDLEHLVEDAGRTSPMSANLEQALLTARNSRMVDRMDKLLREGSTVFFLIGAAHLPRQDGLVAGLRAKGHLVEPVMSTSGPGLPISSPPYTR